MHKQCFIKNIIKFQISFLFTLQCASQPVTQKTEMKRYSATAHLNKTIIKNICAERDNICSTNSNNFKLCTLRMENGKMQFKEFANDCYLFLGNMCDYPGHEWAIKDVESCKNNINLRRFAEKIENLTKHVGTVGQANKTEANESVGQADNGSIGQVANVIGVNGTVGQVANETLIEANGTLSASAEDDLTNSTTIDIGDGATKPELRTKARSTYGVELAPDEHKCPYHCPDVYFPVCVNINRGYGKYYKLLFFVNHCEADMHYCLHWDTEYTPPPYEEYELVNRPSNAAWSYCAANKYMNFATFAESAASLAHYGWLHGSQQAEHILQPHQRVPGYG